MKLTQSQRAVLTSACDQEFAAPPSGRAARQADKMASALIEKGLVKKVRAKAEAPVWGKDEQGRDYALKILKAGRDAVASRKDAAGASKVDASSSANEIASSPTMPRQAKSRRSTKDDDVADLDEVASSSPRAGSKQAIVIAMLREEGGVTLTALVAATGWLPHTTRAALTGLRKKGFEVQLERQYGAPSIYRITKEPAGVTA